MSSKKLLRRFSSSISDLLSIPRRNDYDMEEFIPLHNAVRAGNTIMTKNFIDSKSVWIDEPDSQGRTALHLSIVYGDTEMTSILLKGGANVDATDSNGISSCHLACKDGMIDHFNLLLYYHADVCSVDRTGKTPFDLSCENGQEKMLECLLNCGLQKETFQVLNDLHTASALHLAAANGHVQIVAFLLKHGWDINYSTGSGTALHSAAGCGKTQVVKYLLRAGIDTSIKNADGLASYEWAKKNSSQNPIMFKEIRFLLKNYLSFSNAIAIDNYCGVKVDDLSLSKGDQVWVIDRSDKQNWKGLVFGPKGNSRAGYFKAGVVQEVGEMNGNGHDVNSNSVHLHGNSSFVQLPAVPKRSSSNIHFSDANRNNGYQMSSFGRKSSIKSVLGHDGRTKSVSSSMVLNPVLGNTNRATTFKSKMYASSSCLAPADTSFASACSSSSQSSSGFESVKCSTSYSASSFPSVVPSNESGCESTQSVHSIGSGSGSSSSIIGQEDSFFKNTRDLDVTAMVNSGVPHAEILANWLDSLNMNYYLAVFLKQGYDLQTIARCSPQDLLSLGIKNPHHRKRIIDDIHTWKIADQWPSCVPNNSLREWLHSIALAEYINTFESQNYHTVSDVLNLTWEDFEDIGVKRLGHLKRFGLAIKKIKDYQRNDNSMSSHQPYTGVLNYYPPQNSFSGSRLNDPPPPAPPMPRAKNYYDKNQIDYFSHEKSMPNGSLVNSSYRERKIINCDPLFSDDEPIRLNLVQTGKILSDISKVKQFDDDEQLLIDFPKCPPPPAPLLCDSRLTLTSLNCSSENVSSSNEQLPFANENCGTIRFTPNRQLKPFDVPATLPPLISDDRTSDNSSYSSTTKPTIDEMLQDIQGAMDNLVSPFSQNP